MNVKIKANGVSCLIRDESYDKAYTSFKQLLGEGEEQLFTPRLPGHEYLQWVLPGDGWCSLEEADPLMANWIRDELSKRKQRVMSHFGQNQLMAQRVLTVPDDSYVYYKSDNEGHLLIRLTAWGYRYPERIGKKIISGDLPPREKRQEVAVRIVFDGYPVAAKPFIINGFKRETNENGSLQLGALPLGYRLEIDVDGNLYPFIVESGRDTFLIDLTQYTQLIVKVLLDENPCPDTPVTIEYSGITENVLTNADGCIIKRLVWYPSPNECRVSVLQKAQSRQIDREQVEILFQCKKTVINPPVPPILPAVPEPCALVHVWTLLDGHPCPDAIVSLEYDDKKEYLKTDKNGCISKEVTLNSSGECVVEWEGVIQRKVLDEKGTHFLLQKQTAVGSPVPSVRKEERTDWTWLELLLLLPLVAILVVLTYWVGGVLLEQAIQKVIW